MNLAYPLTETAEINGTEYKIDMSFDNVLRLFDLVNDDDLNDYQKVHLGLLMMIDEPLEDHAIDERASIFIKLFKSVIGSNEEEQQEYDIAGNPLPKMKEEDERAYDLVQDAGYIYASFMHNYQIDLFEQQGKLHWEKFKALLNGLTSETVFGRVVGIRTAELPKGKHSSRERERLKKLKKQFALKEDDSYD